MATTCNLVQAAHTQPTHTAYHEVSTQKGLQEAALATANVPKDITAEDAALGLLLLQVNLLIPGHCRRQATHKHGCQRIRGELLCTAQQSHSHAQIHHDNCSQKKHFCDKKMSVMNRRKKVAWLNVPVIPDAWDSCSAIIE